MTTNAMRRRSFITLLGVSASAWPLAAGAQQPERVRRIGVLTALPENDPENQARLAAFHQGLERLGWTIGRNVRIDYRATVENPERARSGAAELLALQADIILANGSLAAQVLQQATRTVPVVFTSVSEPVAQGFAASLARPGGNMTGFSNLEPTIGAKWLELLKDIAPRVARVALLFNPDNPPVTLFARSAEAAAQKFAIELAVSPVRELAGIEGVITRLGEAPGGGLILPSDSFVLSHRQRIIELATRHQLPMISSARNFADDGGLVSYGIDQIDQFRQAAAYVSRILRGEMPADLPVQQPVKFALVINMKTAKALGLTVPLTLQVAADEMIE